MGYCWFRAVKTWLRVVMTPLLAFCPICASSHCAKVMVGWYTWYKESAIMYKVFGTITMYPSWYTFVQYIWHNVPVTCNFWRPNMRVMPLCQGGGTCNHRKDSLITRTICKTQQPNISEMVINTTNGWMCCFKKENKSSNVLRFFGHIYERKPSLSWQTFN